MGFEMDLLKLCGWGLLGKCECFLSMMLDVVLKLQWFWLVAALKCFCCKVREPIGVLSDSILSLAKH